MGKNSNCVDYLFDFSLARKVYVTADYSYLNPW